MILTKTVSCVFSSFMNATRCITVWIVSVCIGMESVQWESGCLQVIGFILLVIGNLTYNEVIEWPGSWLKRGLRKYAAGKIRDKSNSIYKKEKLATREEVMARELAKNSFLKVVGGSEKSQSVMNSETENFPVGRFDSKNSWAEMESALHELENKNGGSL